MGIGVYLIIGLIIEIVIMKQDAEAGAPYTMGEVLVGAIIDIVAWPIVLLVNILGRLGH